MAISRAQLLKELLPGLNALFGMEYSRYGEEHKEIFVTETSERSFEEEVKLSGFSAAPVRTKVRLSLMTTRKRLSLLVTAMRRLLWASRSLKRRSKTTCMTASRLVIPRLLPVLWLTPSKSRLQTS